MFFNLPSSWTNITFMFLTTFLVHLELAKLRRKGINDELDKERLTHIHAHYFYFFNQSGYWCYMIMNGLYQSNFLVVNLMRRVPIINLLAVSNCGCFLCLVTFICLRPVCLTIPMRIANIGVNIASMHVQWKKTIRSTLHWYNMPHTWSFEVWFSELAQL